MKRMWQILSPVIIILVLLSLAPAPLLGAQSGDDECRRVIILISDYTSTSDLVNANTPNLDTLLSQSSSGLMNIRARNRHPASSYMSLASGSRVGTLENAGLAYNSAETVASLPGMSNISPPPGAAQLFSLFTGLDAPVGGVVNLLIEPVKKSAENYNPSYQPGNLGREAREAGYTVAVLGNSDTNHSLNRHTVILAMDENGVVPLGNVGPDLLEANPLSLGGLQNNHDQFIAHLNKLLPRSDILIADLGDTSRVELSRNNTNDLLVAEHRQKAIERNDLLLGRIMDSIDLDNTMLIILSPNPSKEMSALGNFGLTPALVYNPDLEPGLLISSTTRRSGLVSNSDLKPTVFSYLQHNNTPAGITNVQADNSFEKLDQQLSLYTNLRASRNPLHYTFMFLAVLAVLAGALAYIVGRQEFSRYVNYAVYCVLSVPLVFLFISFSQYFSLGGVIILSLLAAMLVAGIVQFLCRDPLDALLFFTLTTAILLIFDTFTSSRLMLVSPLGSDAIAGGRFYGIGNDYMGILLASTIIATLLVLNKLRHLPLKPVHKALLGLLPLGIAGVAIGHPLFGTNMGGFITVMVAMGFFYLLVGGRKISLPRIFLILFLAILAVFAVAQLDALLNPSPSHAGKAISTLQSSAGITYIFMMIKTKLGILGSTIYNSSWSLVLLLLIATLAALKIKAPHLLLRLAIQEPALDLSARILLVAAITVFVVNDTGVIAAAFMVLYLLCCLWLGLGRGNHPERG